MNWYLAVLKKYAVFDGRARRKEYWIFGVLNVVFIFSLTSLDVIIFDDPDVLSSVYALVVLLPSLAVTVRRLHDVGKSGWWIFILAIPFIGIFWFIALAATDSQPGTNQYGPHPKGVDAAA